jgi:hypothetical protein
VAYCRREGLVEEVTNAQYPHPYLILYLEACRHADPMTGAVGYPEPEKGYLDQDADLTLAFAVCDEYREEQQRIEKQREQVATALKERGW